LRLFSVLVVWKRVAYWHSGRGVAEGWLCPDRGHKRPDAHDVHDAGEIVGEYV
jgi:hypothetical protein